LVAIKGILFPLIATPASGVNSRRMLNASLDLPSGAPKSK
jgi:hypothetical protein